MSAATRRVARAFVAAGIPAERWGEARLARLSDAEREFYRWILRGFADGRRPDAAAAREAAWRLGLDPDDAFDTLAREDLVHRDVGTREIAVAYPFSGRPTAHRVRIGGRNAVDAMCAIDALGTPSCSKRRPRSRRVMP
jgi:hypothetical protein